MLKNKISNELVEQLKEAEETGNVKMQNAITNQMIYLANDGCAMMEKKGKK